MWATPSVSWSRGATGTVSDGLTVDSRQHLMGSGSDVTVLRFIRLSCYEAGVNKSELPSNYCIFTRQLLIN